MSRPRLIIAVALASLGAAPGATSVQATLRQLTSDEIIRALRGKLVVYSPPGWADSGVQEEYRAGGRWTGVRNGEYPVPFAGRWKVQKNLLCVRAESGLSGEKWAKGWVCRKVWIRISGKLVMPHLTLGVAPELGVGPMEPLIQPLS